MIARFRNGIWRNCLYLAKVIPVLLLAIATLIALPAVRADCPATPPTTQPVEALVNSQPGRDSTVAIDAVSGAGRFIIAWLRIFETGETTQVRVQRFDGGGQPICNPQGDCPTVIGRCTGIFFPSFGAPSIALDAAANPMAALVFTGAAPLCTLMFPANVFLTTVPFNDLPVSPICPPCATVEGAFEPSAGLADTGDAAIAWTRLNPEILPDGLVYATDGVIDQIEDCDFESENGPFCHPGLWQPCMAMAPDGRFVIAHADAEQPVEFPHFNIVLRQYNSAGTQIGNVVTVNDPATEPTDSSQLSPAVAFDGENIVVTWIGPNLPECSGGSLLRIFVRRFAWNGDPQGSGPLPLTPPLIVDNDPVWEPISAVDANPTVALIRSDYPGCRARFIVAWNVQPVVPPPFTHREVHGQYFAADGRARFREFRVNVDTSATGSDDTSIRLLANSAQHTVAYGADEQVVATWRAGTSGESRIWFTVLPPGYAREQLPGCSFCQTNPDCCDPCRKSDTNGDCLVNGDDIQYFTKYLINGPWLPCATAAELCPFDLNGDGLVDSADQQIFICILLALCDCQGQQMSQAAWGGDDCNGNGIPDTLDIEEGRSADCNGNGIPDECDLGFDPTVTDYNGNMIPDECEPQTADAQPPARDAGFDEDAAWAAFGEWARGADFSGMAAWEVGYRIKQEVVRHGIRLPSR
jgi:hypothetical protein